MSEASTFSHPKLKILRTFCQFLSEDWSYQMYTCHPPIFPDRNRNFSLEAEFKTASGAPRYSYSDTWQWSWKILRAGLTGSDQTRHFRNMLLLVKLEAETNILECQHSMARARAPSLCLEEITRICPDQDVPPNEKALGSKWGKWGSSAGKVPLCCPFSRWPKLALASHNWQQFQNYLQVVFPLFCSINYRVPFKRNWSLEVHALHSSTKTPNKTSQQTNNNKTYNNRKPKQTKNPKLQKNKKRGGREGVEERTSSPKVSPELSNEAKCSSSIPVLNTHQISSILDHVQPSHTLLVSQQMYLATPERRATRATGLNLTVTTLRTSRPFILYYFSFF